MLSLSFALSALPSEAILPFLIILLANFATFATLDNVKEKKLKSLLNISKIDQFTSKVCSIIGPVIIDLKPEAKERQINPPSKHSNRGDLHLTIMAISGNIISAVTSGLLTAICVYIPNVQINENLILTNSQIAHLATTLVLPIFCLGLLSSGIYLRLRIKYV